MERSSIQSYKDLIVWQRSMDLVIEVYKITEQYPKTEVYGLTAQSRRCVVSMPSNIAGGTERGTRKDYRQFLIMARASGAELATQLEIARRLSFRKDSDFSRALELLHEVMRMLNKMIASLN